MLRIKYRFIPSSFSQINDLKKYYSEIQVNVVDNNVERIKEWNRKNY